MLIHRAAHPEWPARVVVLGGSGVVGRAVVRQLKTEEVEVISVSSHDVDLSMADAVAVLQRMVRPGDALVMAAAITPDKGKDTATLMKNLSMGRHLSAFLSHTACSHVVYISSDAVYDERVSVIQDTIFTAPTSFHGLMHLVRERMLLQVASSSKTPLAILRPTLLYGPEDTHQGYGPNRFMRSMLQTGTMTLFGRGEERRDHVFLEDLARLIGLCLRSRCEGVLNVATGRAVAFAEVARLIAELSGEHVHIERVPRNAPITHRHFDTAERARAFPTFRCTPLQVGLTETLRALNAEMLEARRS